MTDLGSVEGYARDVAGWPDDATVVVRRFDGGERHTVFRVSSVVDDRRDDLVVRVSLSDTADERADVERETRVLAIVQGVVAPRLRDVCLEGRWFAAPCMALEFVPGDQRELAASDSIDLARLGRVVSRLHGLRVDGLVDDSDVAGGAASYRARRIEQVSGSAGFVRDPLPRPIQARLRRAMSTVRDRLESHPAWDDEELVLLHGDVAGGNVIWGAEPVLIDWEYARVGDAADEIAYLFSQNGLTPLQRDAFWEGYAPGSDEIERIIERVRWWEPVTLLGSAFWWIERATRRADADVAGRGDPDAPRATDHYLTQAARRLDRLETFLR